MEDVETRRDDVEGSALILTDGALASSDAKTAHGLIRGSERFTVVGVADDAANAGRDAGELLDGRRRGIPVYGSLQEALGALPHRPDYCILGVATHGGSLTAALRERLVEALRAGLSVVNGLHELVADDPELRAAARSSGARIVDLRRPPPASDLRFWNGAICTVRTPRIAVLGTDCAIGKRTTARLLVSACRRDDIDAELIYTGQTGWMQGGEYGFILDAVINDFVCGELEGELVRCDRERSPDLMVIEGQASLRNPAGPCGAEFLVSGGARGVILQHAPGRRWFEGHEELEWRLPTPRQEIRLVRQYGARTLAVALNGEALSREEIRRRRSRLREELEIPVVLPVEEGVEALLDPVRRFIDDERARNPSP